MKKILLISNMYPSKKYKHYGVFVENTANILKENGYKVTVSALKKKDTAITKLMGYSWFYCKAVFIAMLGHYDYLYAHYISHCALLIKIIKKIKPNIKVIVNVHGNDVVPENKHDEKFIPMVKEVLPLIDICITPSQYFQNIMVEQYRLPENIVKVFPSGGVDLKVFKHFDHSKSLFDLDEHKMIIGYVGRYEIRKGWEIFLEAIHLLDDQDQYQFVMVGTGEEESQADDMIDKYHLNVKKFQMLNQKDLAKLYSAIDIFCFPTYRKSESLGLVGLEAMACGAITIASNMAGPTSYIEDKKNGFFFEPCNPQDLKLKIELALHLSSNEREAIRNNAYQTVKKYDIGKISHILTDIFQSIK